MPASHSPPHQPTDRAGVGIVSDPLDHHEEDQPAKDAEQEQHLRNELHKETDVSLVVAAGREGRAEEESQ